MRYRGLIINDVNPSASAEEITALELRLGRQIPEDYREFLIACNGGYLDYEVPIEFDDGHVEYLTFSTLYRLQLKSSWGTNPYELDEERKNGALPQQGVLPIGRDGGGSTLYLDLREGYRIVAFVHGLPVWTEKRQQDSLVVVANSFSDYLSRLIISDDAAEDHIATFQVTHESVVWTMEWLDSGSPGWREKFRDLWNSRVPDLQV